MQTLVVVENTYTTSSPQGLTWVEAETEGDAYDSWEKSIGGPDARENLDSLVWTLPEGTLLQAIGTLRDPKLIQRLVAKLSEVCEKLSVEIEDDDAHQASCALASAEDALSTITRI